MQQLKRLWSGGFEVFLALVLFSGRSSLPSWSQELLLSLFAGLWFGSAVSRFFIKRFFHTPELAPEQLALEQAEYRAKVLAFREGLQAEDAAMRARVQENLARQSTDGLGSEDPR